MLAAGALAIALAGDDDIVNPGFGLFARQRLENVASTFSKTYSAYLGTLERYFSRAPAGVM